MVAGSLAAAVVMVVVVLRQGDAGLCAARVEWATHESTHACRAQRMHCCAVCTQP